MVIVVICGDDVVVVVFFYLYPYGRGVMKVVVLVELKVFVS